MEKVKTIVLLHGWGKSGESMQPLASLFRERGYITYTPDLPGFGSADVPTKPWCVDDYVAWLKQYLDEKKLSRIILVTQSFGGRVAIKFAVQHPEYLEKLIMCGVPGIKDRLSWKRWILERAVRFGKRWLWGATWELWVPWLLRKYIERKCSRLDYFRVQGVMRTTLSNVVKEDLRPNLSKITTPTLLVWGEHDEYISVRAARIIEKEIPSARLIIIPNTAHKVYSTHPNLVANHILTFIQ